MQIFAVLLPKYNRCSSAVLTGEETGPARECTCLIIIIANKHFSFPGNRSDNLPAQGILSMQVLHYICNTFVPFKKAVLSLTGAVTCQRVSGMRGLFWTAVTSFIREYWWIFIVIVGPCMKQPLLPSQSLFCQLQLLAKYWVLY